LFSQRSQVGRASQSITSDKRPQGLYVSQRRASCAISRGKGPTKGTLKRSLLISTMNLYKASAIQKGKTMSKKEKKALEYQKSIK
jgi:hypothetical protein